MNYELLEKKNGEVKIKVTVSSEDFNDAVKKAYQKSKGQFNLPGFRKGKAPQGLIEKSYGESIFFEDAINILLPEVYPKALDELEISPVARPDIEIEQVGKKEGFIFTAVVTVKPDYDLTGYQGLEVEKVDAEYSDELVDAEIEKMRKQNARIVSVLDRNVEDGDRVLIDYKGLIDGEAFEGGTAENQEIEIGSGTFIPGFEEQLIGAAIGDEQTVEVSFPEDYHADDLKGKAAVFEVKIHGIKEEVLPSLDDDFVKDISEFDTMKEYKDHLAEELKEKSEKAAEAAQRDKVIEAVTELLDIEIPEKMIEAEAEGMKEDFENQLRYQGLSLDQYAQFMGGMEALDEQFKNDALPRIKTSLVIEKIIEKEEIDITEEEIEEELKNIAELQKREIEEIRKVFDANGYDYLKNNLKSRKAVDFLVEHAVIK